MEKRDKLKIFLFQALMIVFVMHSLDTLHVSPPRMILQPPNYEIIRFIHASSNGTDNSLLLECKAESTITVTATEGDEISWMVHSTNLTLESIRPSNNILDFKYNWTKDGKPFDWTANSRVELRLGEGTLIINNPHEEDNGQYQCFAQNDYGVATSNSVLVRIFTSNPPEDEEPNLENAIEGRPFKFDCQAPTEWPKPLLFWIKLSKIEKNITVFEQIDDVERLGTDHSSDHMILDQNGTLYFSQVSRSDASDGFHYACVVTTKSTDAFQILKRIDLNVTSEPIAENTSLPKLLFKSNEFEEVMWGEDITLICIFDVRQNVTWKKDGKSEIDTYGVYINDRLPDKQMSFTIKNAKQFHSGAYTCADESSNQTHTMRLTVNVPPFFINQPTVQNLRVNDTAIIKCLGGGIPKVIKKWTHNGKLIEESSRVIFKQNALVIKNVTESDIGNYGCNVSNSVGYAYKDVYLNVLEPFPPVFIETPDHLTSPMVGESIILPCRAFGVPTPQIRWTRNGQPLPANLYTTFQNGDLNVRYVEKALEGKYTCYASNNVGHVNETSYLYVRNRRQVIIESDRGRIVFGGSVKLSCAVPDEFEEYTIKWFFKMLPINVDDNSKFTISDNTSLIISNVTSNDTGPYKCEAMFDNQKEENSIYILAGYDHEIFDKMCNCGIMRRDHPFLDSEYAINYKTQSNQDQWKTYNSSFIPISWENYTFNISGVHDKNGSIITKTGHCVNRPSIGHSKLVCEHTTSSNLDISWDLLESNSYIDYDTIRMYYTRSDTNETHPIDITDLRNGKFFIYVDPSYSYTVYAGVSTSQISEKTFADCSPPRLMDRIKEMSVFVAIIGFIMSVACVKHLIDENRRWKKYYDFITYFNVGCPEKYDESDPLYKKAQHLPYDLEYEVSKGRIHREIILGRGQFGIVHYGKVDKIMDHEEKTEVAIKTVKDNSDTESLRALVIELKILIHLGHHLNVVRLLGANTINIKKRELFVILEYCPYGNLQKFIRDHRQYFVDQILYDDDNIWIDQEITTRYPEQSADDNDSGINSEQYQPRKKYIITSIPDNSGDESSNEPQSNLVKRVAPLRSLSTTDLLHWSYQIARGMEYLASRKMVHGDLAARNVLLCEGNVVKICDFGLTRTIDKDYIYVGRQESPLPIKWLAPETYKNLQFWTPSDVWSFGILMWELFSLGKTPYQDIDHSNHKNLFERINDNYRMEKPDYATQEIYEIMLNCWQIVPEYRPPFNQLARRITRMIGKDVAKHYDDLNAPNIQANRERFNSTKNKTNHISLDVEEEPTPSISSQSTDKNLPEYIPMTPLAMK